VISQDAVATSQEETSKQINQLRTELDAKTKETKMIKEEFTRREEERFEKIRDLFSRVLSVCIGAVSFLSPTKSGRYSGY